MLAVGRLASATADQCGGAGRIYNRLSALHARAFGARNLYCVRPPQMLAVPGVNSPYDLAPLSRALEVFLDFQLLNEGTPRLSVTATDVETGEAVFDSGEGERIGPEHLIASCGFVPKFEAAEIGGGCCDGGLVANAPVDAILGGVASDEDLVCFIVDLFARDAERPKSIEDAAAR